MGLSWGQDHIENHPQAGEVVRIKAGAIYTCSCAAVVPRAVLGPTKFRSECTRKQFGVQICCLAARLCMALINGEMNQVCTQVRAFEVCD